MCRAITCKICDLGSPILTKGFVLPTVAVVLAWVCIMAHGVLLAAGGMELAGIGGSTPAVQPSIEREVSSLGGAVFVGSGLIGTAFGAPLLTRRTVLKSDRCEAVVPAS